MPRQYPLANDVDTQPVQSEVTCIYCPHVADSREHWLPDWLGAFHDAGVLEGRLCECCNQRLGRELDHEMSRTGPEALDRFRLQIGDSGTDWTKSNPFNFRSQQSEPPTVATARFPARTTIS